MISKASAYSFKFSALKTSNNFSLLQFFIYGLLLPFSFAPFHYPIFALIVLALFYHGLTSPPRKKPFLHGLVFGLGFFGLGTSWIYISIHDYGHLNSILSATITFVFLLYLSLFTAVMAMLFTRLSKKTTVIWHPLLFAALWTLSEYLRAILFSGFPWLLIGIGQIDAPTHLLLPVVGVFGVSFLTCLSASFFSKTIFSKGLSRLYNALIFTGLLLTPLIFSQQKWIHEEKPSLSVAVIQANLSMRDKWDENLFWQLLSRYEKNINALLGTQLIVMPESAIPLPTTYLHEFFGDLQQKAKKANSAILLGIPQPTSINENDYYNALISLGNAKGNYLKQHLVPFGEYIPVMLNPVMRLLDIPDANLQAGKNNQTLIQVQKHPVATLICYELAYGDLLRHQLPKAQWIVSIVDDGWFGHSLAMYQQQQIAQVRSLQAGRYQVLSNNDGLSSIINTKGQIVASLPAFSAGILKASLNPATGTTPWVYWGDEPTMIVCLVLLIAALVNWERAKKSMTFRISTLAAGLKRRYPYQSD